MAVAPPSALVLRALGLGDLLTGVPALRGIRRALPSHQVVLAAPAALEPLVALTGAVDRLLPVPGLVEFDHPRPEVAVNLHGRGPQSHQLLVRLRPHRLAAFGTDGPRWRDDEHEALRWCRLVRDTLGGDPDPGDLLLATPAEPPPVAGAVVVHPGAAHRARQWPPERYARVAADLAGVAPVVVTGSAAERPLAERVRRLAGLPPESVLAGDTSLPRLAALVADARLVVCGDTGPAHLATAYRTRSVVLFGPVPPALWGPPADGPHIPLWYGTRRGDPWADRPDPALLAIGVDDVLEAAYRLVSPAPRGARPGPTRTRRPPAAPGPGHPAWSSPGSRASSP